MKWAEYIRELLAPFLGEDDRPFKLEELSKCRIIEIYKEHGIDIESLGLSDDE